MAKGTTAASRERLRLIKHLHMSILFTIFAVGITGTPDGGPDSVMY